MMQTRPKLMGMVIIASVLWCAPARPVSAFMQQAADKPTYTIPEYNAFQAARGETNPQNRIKLLDDFVTKFPNSTLMPYVTQLYLSTYTELKDYPKVIDTADKVVAQGDKVDAGVRLQALQARVQAFSTAFNPKAADAHDQLVKERDAAKQGSALLQAYPKPANSTMSDADFAAAERGIAAGARHATHTFNAMRPLDHRSPGILGAVLTDGRVSADIIADGVHLDPAIVKLFADAKGAALTVLITDAISATGMPEGRYRLGSFEVDVRDGKCMVDGKLAGSVLTMDRAVRNLARFAEWDLSQAVAAASQNPARVARIANKGVLAVGADADFVVLNSEGEVLRTFVGGVECSE